MGKSRSGLTKTASSPARPGRLSKLTLEGYKSFRSESVDFNNVTVLLGANGAGKSNLLSFFRMLSFLSSGALQEYIGRAGHSDAILFGGRKKTPQLRAAVEFAGDDSEGGKHRTVYRMSECRGYHFHDTSPQAGIRSYNYIEDNRYLRHDASNLGPCLHAIDQLRPDCYQRIVETVRQVFPAFGDFRLAPGVTKARHVLLNWHEKDRSDHLLGPHQLSDGSLRFMALATLFLQPPERLPNVILLDEPELGLHPYAVGVLAAMVKAAAATVQVVLATQSTRLVDEFEPHQIVVLETEGSGGTRRRSLNPSSLAQWLEEYSLGELWEKNRLGGRP